MSAAGGRVSSWSKGSVAVYLTAFAISLAILGREFGTASPRRIIERLRERPTEALAGETAASG